MTPEQAQYFAQRFDAVVGNVERFIQGKDDVVRLALVALLAEGHVLMEDVPGTGKTSLARSLSASLGLTGSRVQFTPDLLPSDVTGVTVFHQSRDTFEFIPVRCSPTSCSPTRSTGRRRKRSRPCSR
ncbi:MAG: AAA family ATPase [Candidatus Nanopelagicales bacterium]